MTSPYERCLWGTMRIRTATALWGAISILIAPLSLLSTFYVSPEEIDQLPNEDSSRDFKETLLYVFLNLATGSLAVYGAIKQRPNFLLPLLMYSVKAAFDMYLNMIIGWINATKKKASEADLDLIIGSYGIYLMGALICTCTASVTYKCFKHFKYQKNYVA
uniref:CASP-like protein n=1 Tax=Steinernema glaseri TaxID=37863 RepID=A0A1I7Y100_9BILA